MERNIVDDRRLNIYEQMKDQLGRDERLEETRRARNFQFVRKLRPFPALMINTYYRMPVLSQLSLLLRPWQRASSTHASLMDAKNFADKCDSSETRCRLTTR
jgi:hypothetical protein